MDKEKERIVAHISPGDYFNYAGPYGNPYATVTLLSAMLQGVKIKQRSETPEEKQTRLEERAKREENQKIKAYILANICPEDGSKLVRGKKDKKNGYKRPWVCQTCGLELHMPD
jgi:rubrerythrin